MWNRPHWQESSSRPSSLLSMVLLLGLTATDPVAAGVNAWTRIGPDGGALCAVIVAPSDPRIVYAVSGRTFQGPIAYELFRSDDGGLTWRATNLPVGEASCHTAVDAADPNRLYGVRSGGLFRSVDGGETWAKVGTGLPAALYPGSAVAVTAQNPDVLFLALGFGGLFRSLDRGDSWQEISGQPQVGFRGVVVHPTLPDRVVAVTAVDGLLLSTDLGEQWTAANGDLPASVIGYDFLFDPNAVDRFFFHTYSGLYRTDDGGLHWTVVQAASNDNDQIESVAVQADSDLYVSRRLDDTMLLLRSRDGGDAWETLANPFPHQPQTSPGDLVAAPTALFAAGPAGLLRSVDDGSSWRESQSGLYASETLDLGLDRQNPERIHTHLRSDAHHPPGILRSIDRGGDWLSLEVPLLRPNIYLQDVEIDPSEPERIYVLGAPQYLEFDALLRSDDGGATWSSRATPSGCWAPGRLAIDPINSSRLYLSGSYFFPQCIPDCFTFRSDDAGETWTCIGNFVLPGKYAVIAPSPFSAGVVLALATDGIHRSTTHGDSWTLVAPLPDVPGAPSGYEATFNDIAWASASTVYAANDCAGLYVSEDAGASWAPVPATGSPLSSLQEIEVSALEPASIYALGKPSCGPNSPSQVVHSGDRGASWTELDEGLRGWTLSDLTQDPVTPNRLLVSAYAGGVLAYEHRRNEPCVPSDTALCLNGGRFRLQSLWRDFDGNSGVGRAAPLTGDTGAFWFFEPENLELFVKELDGQGTNGAYWTFYGALSNVEFTLLATDTATGAQHGYFNPRGRFASLGDIDSFPQPVSLQSGGGASAPRRSSSSSGSPLGVPGGTCVASSQTLCLLDGRFAVTAIWRDFAGNTGVAAAQPLTGDTGSFWFFAAGNHELAIKLIDGRDFNEAFWVFYASLSNVEFDVTVTDTANGATWSRTNPSGLFASGGDIEAFPAP